jgi:hypothetical protein
MAETKITSLITEPELAQLNFERELWIYHRDADERANHRNADALRYRAETMNRLDGLLDVILQNWYKPPEEQTQPNRRTRRLIEGEVIEKPKLPAKAPKRKGGKK